MSRRKYKEGYSEAITLVVWAIVGIPMLLITFISWLFTRKK